MVYSFEHNNIIVDYWILNSVGGIDKLYLPTTQGSSKIAYSIRRSLKYDRCGRMFDPS